MHDSLARKLLVYVRDPLEEANLALELGDGDVGGIEEPDDGHHAHGAQHIPGSAVVQIHNFRLVRPVRVPAQHSTFHKTKNTYFPLFYVSRKSSFFVNTKD